MAWQDVKSLNKLSVQLETGSHEINIYGNGRHQIGVVVYVEGLNSNGDSVSITAEDILAGSNTQLIDAVTGDKLNWKVYSGWNYTDIENEYHTIPTGGRAKRDARGTTAKYYVQCHPDDRLRTKSIAVKANLTNGTTYSTADHGTPGFHSKVQIIAREKKVYTMNDMNLEREDTANGIKDVILTTTMCPNTMAMAPGVAPGFKDCTFKVGYDYDNYCFFIRNREFYIKNAYINGYVQDEGQKQVSTNAFYNRFPEDYGNFFYVGYIWDMSNEQQSKKITLYTKDISDFKENIEIDITVNQVPNAIYLTRVKYIRPRNDLRSVWRNGGINEENLDMSFRWTNINIYDQYGNIGKFHARPDDHEWGNKIKIINGYG